MKNKRFICYFSMVLILIYVFALGIFVYGKNIIGISMSIFCIMGLLLLRFLNKQMSSLVDDNLFIVLNLFMLFASVLGSGFGFYNINYYDDFLHLWSGFIAVSAGLSILRVTNNNLPTTKIFAIVFLVVFGLAIGSIWEIYEYLMDMVVKTNMQAGGLVDSMIDMMDGFLGSSIMIGILYFKGDLHR
ncbi:MAG: hypothetical protein RSB70_04750 [Clostridium sp.]